MTYHPARGLHPFDPSAPGELDAAYTRLLAVQDRYLVARRAWRVARADYAAARAVWFRTVDAQHDRYGDGDA